MFIVTGDHGMEDTGSHGGSNEKESHVPLFTYGKFCSNKIQYDDLSQIDIVPTLATLLGIPIPQLNLGSIILELIDNFEVAEKLFALYYNAEQMLKQYKKLRNYEIEGNKLYTNYNHCTFFSNNIYLNLLLF